MKLKTLSCALLVAAAAFLVYWPSLGYPFQFDDSLLLRDYNAPNGRWMPFFWPPKPRVLTWLIFLIQYQFHGLNPIPYHAFSLLLHAANSVLAFFLLRLIFQHFPLPPRQEMASGVEAIIRKRPFFLFPALSGALIFALHPLQTESVLYIYQRSTLLV